MKSEQDIRSQRDKARGALKHLEDYLTSGEDGDSSNETGGLMTVDSVLSWVLDEDDWFEEQPIPFDYVTLLDTQRKYRKDGKLKATYRKQRSKPDAPVPPRLADLFR